MLGERVVEEQVCGVDFLLFGTEGYGRVLCALLEDFVEGAFGTEDVFGPAREEAGVVGGDGLRGVLVVKC